MSRYLNTKYSIVFSLMFFFLLLLFFLDLFLGSSKIPVKQIFNVLIGLDTGKEEWQMIVMNFRLPKAFTAILVGVALSLSGLLMQTIFRNPLAGPYVLGISSGSGLGVAIVVMGFSSILNFGHMSYLTNWTIVIASWIGAASVLFLILLVSYRIKDIMTILILGLMYSSAASALISILQYFSSETMLKSYVIWTLGSLSNVTIKQLLVLTPGVLIGVILAVSSIKWLDALLLGENYARSMGMKISRVRILVFVATTLMAGSVTAFCGPIGFIGIAVPQLVRLLFKTAEHKILIPGSILMGGIVMLLSDIVSQLPGSQMNLPINSITALIGIPVVIWIVIRNKRINAF